MTTKREILEWYCQDQNKLMPCQDADGTCAWHEDDTGRCKSYWHLSALLDQMIDGCPSESKNEPYDEQVCKAVENWKKKMKEGV